MELKLGHIEVFVNEPLISKEFYINMLGFRLIEIQHDKFVWLQSGNTEILLRPGKNLYASEKYQYSNIAFVIYADNIEEALVNFKEKGVEILGDDGPGCYTFKDPDGNWIQLVKPEY